MLLQGTATKDFALRYTTGGDTKKICVGTIDRCLDYRDVHYDKPPPLQLISQTGTT